MCTVKKINIFIFSFILIFAIYALQGSNGFSLWDEGFLWYGVQRVMLGEVPILDFMAYDPGRYYWSAAILNICGDDSIMSLRAVVACFQALGLFLGCLLIAMSGNGAAKHDALFLIISAITLVVWMFPRHKLFDISISIFLIGVLTNLIEKQTARRYFITGVFVGMVAVFGRNHGLYGVLGSVGVICWLSIKNETHLGILRTLLYFAVGVLVGYLPVILMIILVPNFTTAFLESIRFLFERSNTNLPLPLPWPWRVSFVSESVGVYIREVLIGVFFIGILLFGLLSLIWVVFRKVKQESVPPAVVASAFLALPYTHFAYSRADVGHLAQGIFPLLIGCLVILSRGAARIKWTLVIVLCVASFWVMLDVHPGWQCFKSKQCVTVQISGNELYVDAATAADIKLLRQLTSKYAPNDESFIATPFWPGAYALLERKSPMWEIYALFNRSDKFQQQEIERIESAMPSFAFIYDFPLDGRNELRFENTHPLINQYILDNFDYVPYSPNPAYKIYRARDSSQ